MSWRGLVVIVLAAATTACASLTAEAPLFTPAEEPPPLTEGVWITINDDCHERNLRRQRFPIDCGPLDIRREPDGSWHARFRPDLVSGLTREELAEAGNGPRAFRAVLAAAVERSTAEAYAPIYVAELTPLEGETRSIGYSVIAPVGALPATEMRFISSIGCIDILLEGQIEGITEEYEETVDADGQSSRTLKRCVAATQAAVREAARRAVIENIDELTQQRYVFVRAN